MLVVCSFLVFVPICYVYPTRTVVFRRLSLTLTALWLGSYAAVLWQMPQPHPLILAFSLLYLFCPVARERFGGAKDAGTPAPGRFRAL